MSWGIDLVTDNETIEVFDGHTYNLTPMWRLAGVFDVSRDLDGMTGRQISAVASAGLRRAVQYPQAFKTLNPDNGWGDYDGFVAMLTRLAVLAAEHPNAKARWNG